MVIVGSNPAPPTKTTKTMRKKKWSVEEQLGYYIGEYIFHTKLPTLSCDMMHSRNVIKVTDEEEEECERLSNLHSKFYRENESSEEQKKSWDDLMNYRKEIQKKYLPPTLDTYVDVLDVDDYKDIKEGIRISLWDCDLCHYEIAKDEDIEITKEAFGYTRIRLFYRG